MKNLASLQIFNQTSFDSGALSGLGAVAHQVTASGSHRVTLLQGDKPIQTMPLLVQPQPPQALATAAAGTAAASAISPASLHINLGDMLNTIGQLVPRQPQSDLEIPSQGYVVFQAPVGMTGYAVQLRTSDSDTQPPSFDSRELHNGDIFTATILRPGKYSVTNSVTGAKADLQVAYPVVSNAPYMPPDALNVTVTDQGFQPNPIQLKPAQGVIFRIGNTRARIQIVLVQPDDGPASGTGGAAPQPTPLRRWVNLNASDTKSS